MYANYLRSHFAQSAPNPGFLSPHEAGDGIVDDTLTKECLVSLVKMEALQYQYATSTFPVDIGRQQRLRAIVAHLAAGVAIENSQWTEAIRCERTCVSAASDAQIQQSQASVRKASTSNLGALYLMLNEPEKALQELQRCIQAAVTAGSVPKFEVCHNLAIAYAKLGPRAHAEYTKV